MVMIFIKKELGSLLLVFSVVAVIALMTIEGSVYRSELLEDALVTDMGMVNTDYGNSKYLIVRHGDESVVVRGMHSRSLKVGDRINVIRRTTWILGRVSYTLALKQGPVADPPSNQL